MALDLENLKEEESLDGYYAIVTSEYEESDDRIIEMYRGLWKIEESVKVTNTILKPVLYMYQKKTIYRHIF